MKFRPVLYVEDDENDTFLMKHAFKQCGIQNPIVSAADGREALEYFAKLERELHTAEENFPCLVLLDLNLPFKNGHDVLRWLRDHQAFRSLVVIMLTSSSHERDVQQAYDLGANAYLVKTPVLEKMIETVKAVRDFWLQKNFVPAVSYGKTTGQTVPR